MKKISIKDIAELSGVSIATVSRVINNNGRFSEETRKKVLSVIENTNYQMNFSAKSLRMNKSFSIGILVPDISNYFFSDVVQKIEEKFFVLGYSTIICNTGRNKEKEQAYLKMLKSKQIDGLIVISGVDEFILPYDDIPYICIDRKPQESLDNIFISSNHYQGAFESTEALLQSGSEHPLMIMYHEYTSSSKERLKGFKDALKKNSYPFQESKNLILIDSKDISSSKELYDYLVINNTIDGIFAVNDDVAMNTLMILSKLKKKVPTDVRVIGFDDTPQCKYSSPHLTSVKQNTDEISKLAVKYLIDLMNNPKLDSESTILVPVNLIRRDSH